MMESNEQSAGIALEKACQIKGREKGIQSLRLLFFFLGFLYLVEKQGDRKRERYKERYFIIWLILQLPVTARVG